LRVEVNSTRKTPARQKTAFQRRRIARISMYFSRLNGPDIPPTVAKDLKSQYEASNGAGYAEN
jgi:hypothetical protein